MEKELFEKIKKFAIAESQKAFGYCGVAEGDDLCMINTGGEQTLLIEIKIEE